MEMSYIAIHRWNETVGMKVLGMSDALTSPISSPRLPRPGFLASAKANPSPPPPFLWFSNRSTVAVLLPDVLLFPSPLFFFSPFRKRIHLFQSIAKRTHYFPCNFYSNRVKESLSMRNIIRKFLESLMQK